MLLVCRIKSILLLSSTSSHDTPSSSHIVSFQNNFFATVCCTCETICFSTSWGKFGGVMYQYTILQYARRQNTTRSPGALDNILFSIIVAITQKNWLMLSEFTITFCHCANGNTICKHLQCPIVSWKSEAQKMLLLTSVKNCLVPFLEAF